MEKVWQLDTFSPRFVKSKIQIQRLKLRKLAKQVETFSPAQPLLLLLRWEARVRNILQIVFAIVIVAAIFSYRTGAGMVASNATNAQGEGTKARYMIKKT